MAWNSMLLILVMFFYLQLVILSQKIILEIQTNEFQAMVFWL